MRKDPIRSQRILNGLINIVFMFNLKNFKIRTKPEKLICIIATRFC